jgi:hypothetical protein
VPGKVQYSVRRIRTVRDLGTLPEVMDTRVSRVPTVQHGDSRAALTVGLGVPDRCSMVVHVVVVCSSSGLRTQGLDCLFLATHALAKPHTGVVGGECEV